MIVGELNRICATASGEMGQAVPDKQYTIRILLRNYGYGASAAAGGKGQPCAMYSGTSVSGKASATCRVQCQVAAVVVR